MFSLGSGVMLLFKVVKAVILEHLPYVGDLAGDGRCGRGERTGEEGAATFALPALKVAVAGADGILARLELVAIHGDAHGTTCFAPFCPGLTEDLSKPLGFGLLFDALGAF